MTYWTQLFTYLSALKSEEDQDKNLWQLVRADLSDQCAEGEFVITVKVLRNPIRVLIEAVPFSKDGQGRKLAPTETNFDPISETISVENWFRSRFSWFSNPMPMPMLHLVLKNREKKLSAKFLGAAVEWFNLVQIAEIFGMSWSHQ